MWDQIEKLNADMKELTAFMDLGRRPALALHRRNLMHMGVMVLNHGTKDQRPMLLWSTKFGFNSWVKNLRFPVTVEVEDELGKRTVKSSPQLMRSMMNAFKEKGGISRNVLHLSTTRDLAYSVHNMEDHDKMFVSKETYWNCSSPCSSLQQRSV